LATNNINNPDALAKQMSNKNLRVYLSGDPVGVQLGGGLKNIVAIAAGASDGLGLGANARAALVTRGLDEIKLLGKELGGNEKTFIGLSGMGDLILSCTDDKSRNRLLGLSIGKGLSFEEAIKLQNDIPEGAHAIKTLVEKNVVSDKQPIMFAVYQLLYKGLDVKKVAEELMLRPIKGEF
jgi:glycerol-3-phosphate dehydrogenase (NAD(P)+)